MTFDEWQERYCKFEPSDRAAHAARQAWSAACEECAKITEKATWRSRYARALCNGAKPLPCRIAAAIRMHSSGDLIGAAAHKREKKP